MKNAAEERNEEEDMSFAIYGIALIWTNSLYLYIVTRERREMLVRTHKEVLDASNRKLLTLCHNVPFPRSLCIGFIFPNPNQISTPAAKDKSSIKLTPNHSQLQLTIESFF